jgi:hypothetical protein
MKQTKLPKQPKPCQVCGTQFVPNRSNQRSCSKQCSTIWKSQWATFVEKEAQSRATEMFKRKLEMETAIVLAKQDVNWVLKKYGILETN